MKSLLRIVGRAAAFAALLAAWAFIAPLAWLTRARPGPARRPLRRGLAVLLLLAIYLVVRGGCTRAHALRIATFNIRNFGVEQTDIARLSARLTALDADVVAVQEIQDPARFEAVIAALAAPRRRYHVVLSQCGGRSRMHVGFVYDSARVDLRGQREFPELSPGADGSCSDGDRSGLLGEFAADGAPFDLLVVHLAAGSTDERASRRRAQWERALAIVAQLRAEGTRAVAVLGDTNSTGFFDDRHGERTFIDARLREADLELPTRSLACSEYYRGEPARLTPSLLDHIALTREFPVERVARVHGYCEELRCQPVPADPAPLEYARVSDHCPVALGR
jgi:endonuclease/exonuclease/phosphatase family metal-dependent hydrolase